MQSVTKDEALATVNRLLAMADEINEMSVRVSNDEAINDVGLADPESPLHTSAEGVAMTAVSIAFANGFRLRAVKGGAK